MLRYIGDERAVVVGVWREGGGRRLPVNAELDFDVRNSALGRARRTRRPARADSYEGHRGELPIVMRAVDIRASVAAPVMLGRRGLGRRRRLDHARAQPLRRTASTGSTTSPSWSPCGRQLAARRRETTSRVRLIEAADAARRRLERDLHEGVQQHLLALTLKLRIARGRADAGSEIARLLEDALEEAAVANAALRDLARSLYPIVLTERGLAAALQALDGEGPDAGQPARAPAPPVRGAGGGDRLLRRRRHARHRAQRRGDGDDRRQGRPAGRGGTRRRPRRAAAGARGARRRDRWPARDRGTGGARRAPRRAVVTQTARTSNATTCGGVVPCRRDRDRRLHLLLAGGGSEEEQLRARLGPAATFLGWLDGDDLAVAYASADLLLFCSETDTFGNVVLEAQASGLPVVAVAGGPAELIESGRSGLLCPPDPAVIGAAVARLASARAARGQLARGASRGAAVEAAPAGGRLRGRRARSTPSACAGWRATAPPAPCPGSWRSAKAFAEGGEMPPPAPPTRC